MMAQLLGTWAVHVPVLHVLLPSGGESIPSPPPLPSCGYGELSGAIFYWGQVNCSLSH